MNVSYLILLSLLVLDGVNKYKVNFEQKGKGLLSGHHVAFLNPPLLAQLSVGSRVTARFHEGKQSWILSAVIAELPDRKNRMRWGMFLSLSLCLSHSLCVCLSLTYDRLSVPLDGHFVMETPSGNGRKIRSKVLVTMMCIKGAREGKHDFA